MLLSEYLQEVDNFYNTPCTIDAYALVLPSPTHQEPRSAAQSYQ